MRILVAAGFACALFADPSIETPRLGYVSSPAGIRKVLGIVGASQLSAPVASELTSPQVLPGTDFAVGTNGAGELVRIDLRDGSTLGLGISNADAIATSPSGETVLALAGESAQLISRDGSIVGRFPIAAKPSLIAIADRDKTAAITIAEPDGEALYVLNEQGMRRVFHAAKIAGLAFVPKSSDLIAADGSGAIYRLNTDLQLTQVTTIEGIRGLAVSADGSRLLAVAGGTVYAVQFGTGDMTSVECPCTGTIAIPLGTSTFLLTSGDDEPLWVLDATSERLRVAFIPEAVNE
jgi:hypothetical protein